MKYRILSLLVGIIAITACVTVNVYFPESAAQRAADRFIRDVYGEDANSPQPPAGENSQSLNIKKFSVSRSLAAIANVIIPQAMAQAPDINIQTPAINSLKSAMSARHLELSPGYDSGAIGMAANGLIVLRDAKAIALQQRNQIKQLVVKENQDRNKLYSEVAKANNHPEWESEIRAIFAQRWVSNAPAGWWYESGGAWKQK